MRIIATLLFFFLVSCSSGRRIKGEFDEHFRILDSAIAKKSSDTIHCCNNSVWFMEKHTGIKATGATNFFGSLGFTTKDVERWHKWHDDKNESVRKN